MLLKLHELYHHSAMPRLNVRGFCLREIEKTIRYKVRIDYIDESGKSCNENATHTHTGYVRQNANIVRMFISFTFEEKKTKKWFYLAIFDILAVHEHEIYFLLKHSSHKICSNAFFVFDSLKTFERWFRPLRCFPRVLYWFVYVVWIAYWNRRYLNISVESRLHSIEIQFHIIKLRAKFQPLKKRNFNIFAANFHYVLCTTTKCQIRCLPKMAQILKIFA